MDPFVCSCHSEKCKAHLCLQQQRSFLRQHCPAALNSKLKPATKPIADSNGRFLNPQSKCSFPWSNYLMEQWVCSCSNSCGMKHIASNTQNLPRYYQPQISPQNQDSNGWEYNGQNYINKNKISPAADQTTCEFNYLKDRHLPIICLYGYGHKPAEETRHQFCRQLALELGFLYLNMDQEIRHGTDELFKRSSTEEVLVLPQTVKRLATMCVQLLGDEELHLNIPGIMELIKLVMINSWIDAQKRGDTPKGFIIEDFPCTRKEAEAFEQNFYPVSLGLYFQGRCWSDVDQKKYIVDPEVQCPMYFRRDSCYSESKVEEVVGMWNEKSIKILNMEDFADYEARHLINLIKEKLSGRLENSDMNFSSDNRTDNNVMQQLAQLYKCVDPNCKCHWNGQGQTNQGQVDFGGGYNGGLGAGAAKDQMTIVCPLERPPKPKVAKEDTKKPDIKETRDQPKLETPVVATISQEVIVKEEPNPPQGENSETSNPTEKSKSKKTSKKSKEKDGSKKKIKDVEEEDKKSSPKSKGKGKNKKARSPESSPAKNSKEKMKRKDSPSQELESSEEKPQKKAKGKKTKTDSPLLSNEPSSANANKESKQKIKKTKSESPSSSKPLDTEKTSKKKNAAEKEPKSPPDLDSPNGKKSKTRVKSAKSESPSPEPQASEKGSKRKIKKVESESPSAEHTSPAKGSKEKVKKVKSETQSQDKPLPSEKKKRSKNKVPDDELTSPESVPSPPEEKKSKKKREKSPKAVASSTTPHEEETEDEPGEEFADP